MKKNKGKKGKTWKEIEKENENEKNEKIDKRKEGPNGVPRETVQKNVFLHKSYNRKS